MGEMKVQHLWTASVLSVPQKHVGNDCPQVIIMEVLERLMHRRKIFLGMMLFHPLKNSTALVCFAFLHSCML